jgi:hypothetical protein
MPSTDQQRSTTAAQPASLKRSQIASSGRSHLEVDLSSESRERLQTLLCADVVELGKVCDEIQLVAPLANFVIKLGESQGFYASTSPPTVEEAVVLLGADRLRVLVNAWPFTRVDRRSESQLEISAGGRGTGASHAANFVARPNRSELIPYESPESLDVVVLRPSLHAGQIDGMVEMLARDFVALAPLLESVGPTRRR